MDPDRFIFLAENAEIVVNENELLKVNLMNNEKEEVRFNLYEIIICQLIISRLLNFVGKNNKSQATTFIH